MTDSVLQLNPEMSAGREGGIEREDSGLHATVLDFMMVSSRFLTSEAVACRDRVVAFAGRQRTPPVLLLFIRLSSH
jgi:hypothetical protein